MTSRNPGRKAAVFLPEGGQFGNELPNVNCWLIASMSPQILFLENESWLRTVVRSRVGESDAVDDIMQNIAVALVKQKDSLTEINRISAWLYQVAVKQVLMYRRTRGRRRNFEDRIVKDPSVSKAFETADPVARVLAAEEREQVQLGVNQLDELDRQILMLKYSEGWTYRQLADHLGIKEDTVEYRLAKARRQLRGLLASLDRSKTHA